MKLEIERQAVKKLRAMQHKTAAAILAALEEIAAAPFDRHANVERIKGPVADGFRLRHGDWRVLYRIDRAAGRMIVEIIDSRGQIYR